MDILKENFPRLFPTEEQVTSKYKETYPIKLLGKRGLSKGEAEGPYGVIECDQQYLDSLRLQFDEVELILLSYFLRCLPSDTDTLPNGPEDHLKPARGILDQLESELSRLVTHSELFPSSMARSVFLRRVLFTLRSSRRLLEIIDDVHSILAREDEEEMKANSSFPTSLESGVKLSPWQSWLHPRLGPSNNVEARDLMRAFPNMTETAWQYVPTEAVLIAEHWREKVDRFVQGIAENSSNPAIVQAFKPSKVGLCKGIRVNTGVSVILRQLAARPMRNHLNEKHLAFGRQGLVAELARFLARIEEDVTTRNNPTGVFQGVFSTNETLSQQEQTRWHDC